MSDPRDDPASDDIGMSAHPLQELLRRFGAQFAAQAFDDGEEYEGAESDDDDDDDADYDEDEFDEDSDGEADEDEEPMVFLDDGDDGGDGGVFLAGEGLQMDLLRALLRGNAAGAPPRFRMQSRQQRGQTRQACEPSELGVHKGLEAHELSSEMSWRSLTDPETPLINPLRWTLERDLRPHKRRRASQIQLMQRFLPDRVTKQVDRVGSRCYIGQFAQDGALFLAGFQDSFLKIYDTATWSEHKTVQLQNVHWTVTDVDLSPTSDFVIYSSIHDVVHLCYLDRDNDRHIALPFLGDDEESMGLWSIRISQDGREIVAGGNDCRLHVYDIETGKVVMQVPAHNDDVNAVAFADSSSNVLFTGSDDATIKIWDRRCLRERRSPSIGTLVGHCEGLTYLDPRGDGRYLLSNAKDQTMKLWDIRQRMDNAEAAAAPRAPMMRWDYRWMPYPGDARRMRHPADRSLMTYTGHSVLKTLIRCHFSPAATTGQKFAYTGSADGSVYVYDLLSGNCLRVLEGHSDPVRDVSWHPTLPYLMSTGWDGRILRWSPAQCE